MDPYYFKHNIHLMAQIKEIFQFELRGPIKWNNDR